MKFYLSRTPILPTSKTKPTPKHMPAPTRPTISDPCNACMRGFDRPEVSAITPTKITNRPVNLVDFRMSSSPACIQAGIH